MKIKKLFILITLLLFISIFPNQNYAEEVSGKIIWVSPFFGFVFIRLDEQKTASQGSDLSIYLKANGKTGKITTLSSYKDVTICKITPASLVREIRKNDTVSGNIKVIKEKKGRTLIDEDIIKDYDRKQQMIDLELEKAGVSASNQLMPGSTGISIEVAKKRAEAKFEEDEKKRQIENANKKRIEDAKQKEEDEKRKEQNDKDKLLYSLTAEEWFKKGETAADSKYKIECFNNAIKLKNDYKDAHYKLGLTYQDNGSLTEALEEYEQVLKLDKNHSLTLNNMADIYKRLGLLDQALDCIKKAVTATPNLAIAWVTYGEILESMGDLDSAIEVYSHAIDDSKWKSYVTKRIEELRKKIK